jgi:type I restriction enzyme S subunit
MSGSVQKNINARVLTAAELAVPPVAVVREFSRTVGPMHRLQASYVREAGALSATRDALLPKLISGEIRVPDTADVAEAIAPAAEELAGT